ncbi:MAG: hypothetical protein AB7U81_11685 [Thiohalomonadaceae bacterium]
MAEQVEQQPLVTGGLRPRAGFGQQMFDGGKPRPGARKQPRQQEMDG